MSAIGTALISGANRGLGLGLCSALLSRGWQIFAGVRSPRDATELNGLRLQHANMLQIVSLDVTCADSVAAAVSEVTAGCAALDVLVNNAGINPPPREAGVADVSVELVASVFDVNLLGALRLLQTTLPLLRRSTSPRVLNISSGAGSLLHAPATPPPPAYCLSKAALNMLTRRAARELTDLTIVSVSPGWIQTDMGGPEADLSVAEAATALATTVEQIPPELSGQWLDRFGRISEFAW